MNIPEQESSLEEANLLGQQGPPNPQLVNQVVSHFKVLAREKRLEESAKLDEKASTIKFTGNRKLFELNSRFNNLSLSQLEDNVDKPAKVRKLVDEGQKLIKKRQKLIKIADRNKESWLVVQEYESDDILPPTQKVRKASCSESCS